jgi:hypothetical protein
MDVSPRATSAVPNQFDTKWLKAGPRIVYREGEMLKTMAEYRKILLLYMIYIEAHSMTVRARRW